MAIVEELKKTLDAFPRDSPDMEELARLQRFFAEMRAAGIARTREYDLPQPDTLGRAASNVATRALHHDRGSSRTTAAGTPAQAEHIRRSRQS